jgi:hypothetical protein
VGQLATLSSDTGTKVREEAESSCTLSSEQQQPFNVEERVEGLESSRQEGPGPKTGLTGTVKLFCTFSTGTGISKNAQELQISLLLSRLPVLNIRPNTRLFSCTLL